MSRILLTINPPINSPCTNAPLAIRTPLSPSPTISDRLILTALVKSSRKETAPPLMQSLPLEPSLTDGVKSAPQNTLFSPHRRPWHVIKLLIITAKEVTLAELWTMPKSMDLPNKVAIHFHQLKLILPSNASKKYQSVKNIRLLTIVFLLKKRISNRKYIIMAP